MRRTYTRLSIAHRHPALSARIGRATLAIPSRLEYWQTNRDGVHVVEVREDFTVRHFGVLWANVEGASKH